MSKHAVFNNKKISDWQSRNSTLLRKLRPDYCKKYIPYLINIACICKIKQGRHAFSMYAI